ncbi:TIGR03086 family metal-binding protein [Nocardia sp. NPDC057353]|uniref:TIGR03086 family metal-binding protein n=1 Tax=Nocardia sp. NPDC057353 TaxID=3346104 RepID=UPI003642E7AC
MSTPETMASAAAPLRRIAAAITPADLDRPTPCAEFDVAALVSHLLYWAPGLAAAGRKQAPPEPETRPLPHDFADTLRARVDDIVAAWSEPQAWRGSAEFAGAVLPAPLLGGMVVGELVVHGWDLGRALGIDVGWDDALLDFLFEQVSATAEQGREMGAYGPAVPVADSAPTLDRILAATGRLPHWHPVTV